MAHLFDPVRDSIRTLARIQPDILPYTNRTFCQNRRGHRVRPESMKEFSLFQQQTDLVPLIADTVPLFLQATPSFWPAREPQRLPTRPVASRIVYSAVRLQSCWPSRTGHRSFPSPVLDRSNVLFRIEPSLFLGFASFSASKNAVARRELNGNYATMDIDVSPFSCLTSQPRFGRRIAPVESAMSTRSRLCLRRLGPSTKLLGASLW